MSVFGVILVHVFPAFPLIQTEYGEIRSIRIQSERGKMRTRITLNTDTFYTVWFPYGVSEYKKRKLGIVRKEWFEYVLVHIFLFIVRYFLSFVLDLLNQSYLYFFTSHILHDWWYSHISRGFPISIFRCRLVWFSGAEK